MAMKYENMRDAIAVMTAWTDDGDDVSFAVGVANDIAAEKSARHLAQGLISLCGWLLTVREADAGLTPNDSLRQAAEYISRSE